MPSKSVGSALRLGLSRAVQIEIEEEPDRALIPASFNLWRAAMSALHSPPPHPGGMYQIGRNKTNVIALTCCIHHAWACRRPASTGHENNHWCHGKQSGVELQRGQGVPLSGIRSAESLTRLFSEELGAVQHALRHDLILRSDRPCARRKPKSVCAAARAFKGPLLGQTPPCSELAALPAPLISTQTHTI